MKRHKEIAYAILRVTVGLMFFFYGVGKVHGGIAQFRDRLLERFSESLLPQPLVGIFATILPFAEILIGGLLVIGLFTRGALVAAALLIATLTFGAVMEPDPPTVAANVNYALVVFVLLWLADHDAFAIDRRRERRN